MIFNYGIAIILVVMMVVAVGRRYRATLHDMRFALLEMWYGIMVCLRCDYFQDLKCHFLLLSKACSGALSHIKTLHNGHSYPYIYI